MKKFKKLLFMGMLVVAAYMLTGCGTTTINLNDYVTIETYGYDTIGTAEVVFDYDKFEDDFEGKIKRDGDEVSTERFLEKCVESITLSQTEGLSNGDMVTISWECDDDRAKENYNCELVYSDIEIEVTGLTEVEVFNPFDHMEVTFEGMEPYATINVEIEDIEEFDYIWLDVDKNYGLKIGDTVTITIEVWDEEEFIETFGAVIGETSKTYEVTALDAYISSFDQIPEEDFKNLLTEGETVFREHVENRWDDPSTLQSITYLGHYFLSEKTEGNGNSLFLVYKINATHPENGGTVEYYFYVERNYIVLKSNGKCDIDDSTYTPGNTFTIDGYYYFGYETIEELYDDVIKAKEVYFDVTTDIE